MCGEWHITYQDHADLDFGVCSVQKTCMTVVFPQSGYRSYISKKQHCKQADHKNHYSLMAFYFLPRFPWHDPTSFPPRITSISLDFDLNFK